MKPQSTPGGNRLRSLRESMGKTQLEIELDAALGSGYLQRVESGKVRHPERTTLERILAALNARYTDRRDILELFGYIVETSVPTADETAWAVSVSQQVLESVPFPAYLLDCTHRLTAWNAFTPRLFALRLDALNHVSMLRLLFDARYGIASLIHNPDEFYPATIRALRYEISLYHGEAWHQDVIDDLLAIPLFRRYWDASQPAASAPARPLTPIEFKLGDAPVLKFRLTSEVLSEDRRFRIIYYLPADAITMQACAGWAAG
jgi:transcriptional regulator with XRE-family HTH domain